MKTCDAASIDEELAGCLDLDPADFAGGVGIWAALAPVFNTTGRSPKTGVHVHARQMAEGGKQIDETFPAVRLRCKTDLFGDRSVLIRRDAAVAYYFSRLLGRRVKHLDCPHCGAVHLDIGEFALRPHRQHLCNACGRHFRDIEDAVSNPLSLVRQVLGDADAKRLPVRASDVLDVRLADYPAGAQIWASNPAILWTAPRPEQEGIHVHLFPASRASPEPDETFAEVRLDGVLLDETMVRFLMAQRSLPHLAGKVESLNCPVCSAAHFDHNEKGFEAHSEHDCEQCGTTFRAPRRRLLVSNPLVSILERLRRNGPA